MYDFSAKHLKFKGIKVANKEFLSQGRRRSEQSLLYRRAKIRDG